MNGNYSANLFFNTYQNHIWIKLYLILSVFYEMFLLTRHVFIRTGSRFNSFHGSSQTGLFQEFLLRANKYNRLQMSGEKLTEDRKIILIEVLHRTAL